MKAIIIIEIPDKSLDGWFVDYLEINKYNTKNTPDFYEFIDGIEYQDCPLKPMPEKRTLTRELLEYAWWENYGYNTCIEEILGEEK